ncbi:PglD-related sugar-binding protein [Arthrobacter sp. SA17]
MVAGLIIVGAGGFGRETIDVVEAINQISSDAENYSLQGVVDDNPAVDDLSLLSRRGVRYLGTTSEVLDTITSDVRYLIGVGSPVAREKNRPSVPAGRLTGGNSNPPTGNYWF